MNILEKKKKKKVISKLYNQLAKYLNKTRNRNLVIHKIFTFDDLKKKKMYIN